MKLRICVAIALASACSSSEDINVQPSFIAVPPRTTTYDGKSNDLLTGGLGKTELGNAAHVFSFADPANPTAAELRSRAIYVKYRALIDPTASGGYGTFYGPNIDVNGGNTLGEGRIA